MGCQGGKEVRRGEERTGKTEQNWHGHGNGTTKAGHVIIHADAHAHRITSLNMRSLKALETTTLGCPSSILDLKHQQVRFREISHSTSISQGHEREGEVHASEPAIAIHSNQGASWRLILSWCKAFPSTYEYELVESEEESSTYYVQYGIDQRRIIGRSLGR